jgi:predicted outer membrane repeat protein
VASGNFSAGPGGGLEIFASASFLVSGGSFTGNVAKDGGGIYITSSTGSITGVTISGNDASVAGGGLFEVSSNVTALAAELAKIFGNAAPADPNFF